MLQHAAIIGFALLAIFAIFLAGAWLADSRRASASCLAVAALLAITALSLSGRVGGALYHACRDGLCR